MERSEAVSELFQRIMERCRLERKSKTGYTVRKLAQQLGVTENYLSTIENGREVPSLKMFLAYLMELNFDLNPLVRLRISDEEASRPGSRDRAALINKIYSLDQDKVQYLAEQVKVMELYRVKQKKRP